MQQEQALPMLNPASWLLPPPGPANAARAMAWSPLPPTQRRRRGSSLRRRQELRHPRLCLTSHQPAPVTQHNSLASLAANRAAAAKDIPAVCVPASA